MFFELRQYHVRPGQQAAWVAFMEEEIIPFQVKHGMVVIRSFVGEQDDSIYYWIRRFESEEERGSTPPSTRAMPGKTTSPRDPGDARPRRRSSPA
ncbi:MAG: NIPSNAP family protein [Thermomicrobiales bacterium]